LFTTRQYIRFDRKAKARTIKNMNGQMSLRAALFLFLLITSLVGYTSCAPRPGSTPSNSGAITDALNRPLSFTKPPQRIVVAGKGAFLLMDALYLFPQAPSHLITIITGAQRYQDFLRLMDPDLAEKLVLAGDAGPEQIAAAKPDAVVMKSYLAGGLGQSVERLGIPVVYLDLETPEQYLKDLQTLGALFGDFQRAESLRAYYREQMQTVSNELNNLAEADKPKVLVLTYSQQGGATAFQVPPLSWMQTKVVELAGGTPVWSEAAATGGFVTVNLEQIAVWNPDDIFLISYNQDTSQIRKTLAEEPSWQMLKAVQSGHFYGFPADFISWDQPDPRWILGLTWMAAKLQPQRFSNPDPFQRIEDFYRLAYSLEETTVQEMILPGITGDFP
jgi:iron complex transport system substrate-binding protein